MRTPRPAPTAGLAAAVVPLLLAASLLPRPARAQPEPLSPHALHKLVERVQPCVLQVVSSPAGFAVLIGVGGELLADDRLVGGKRGSVTVEVKGERREAALLARDAELGLALLKLPPDDYPAASVGEARALRRGAALVGLSWNARRRGPAAEPGHFAGTRTIKGVTRLRNDVAGPAGSALFNSRGQLVAVHAGRSHATVAIEELRERFSRARPQ